MPALLPGQVKQRAYSVMSEKQVGEFEAKQEMNLSISAENLGRFRVNVFVQRAETGIGGALHQEQDPATGRTGPAPGAGKAGAAQARPGAGDRRLRLGQIDHPGVDDQLPQRERDGPHPHHRRPAGVFARAQALGGGPARGGHRHAVVRRSPEKRAARGTRRDHDRRDSRPQHHEAGDCLCRDGPPVPVHAARQQCQPDRWSGSSTSSPKMPTTSC